MYQVRTDLALEAREKFEDDHVEVKGVKVEEEKNGNMTVTRVVIETENGAKAMGKPRGSYITLEAPDMEDSDEDYHREISRQLADILKDLMPIENKELSVLVVGLGNREVTPDALGPRVVDNLLITRHVLKEFGKYPSGNKVTEKPEILFARLDVKEVVEKADAMFAERKAAAESKVDEKDAETKQAADENKGETGQEEGIDIEAKPEIEYGDFDKLQFQVGEIIACEAVKKSKKLLCSQVKIGNQVKQILSGIKQYYSPEEMVGKRVMVLVNLKPATMAGIVSEGMLLCAEDADGNLSLVSPEKEMPSGAVIC